PVRETGASPPRRGRPAGSPARDRVNSGCPPPATDQRGVVRPPNACDSGAFEAQPSGTPASLAVGESVGSATLVAFLSEASTQAVTVNYATASGTAVAGVDFTPVAGTFTFPPGAIARTVQVLLTSDTLDEDD